MSDMADDARPDGVNELVQSRLLYMREVVSTVQINILFSMSQGGYY